MDNSTKSEYCLTQGKRGLIPLNRDRNSRDYKATGKANRGSVLLQNAKDYEEGFDVDDGQISATFSYSEDFGTPISSPFTSASFTPSPFIKWHREQQGEEVQKMNLTTSVFNLTKVMVGAGMLSLPAGMAAGQGTGYMAALVTLVISALGAAYTFYIMGLCFHRTKTSSFKELISKTYGRKAGWFVDFMIVVLGFALGLLYTDFVGDSFAMVLQSWSDVIPEWMASRDVVIVTTVVGVLWPLCLQRNLQALRHSSYLGVSAIFYVAWFMTYRLLDGSYAPGGKYYTSDTHGGKNDSFGLWHFGLGSAVFFSMMVMSFTAHQNAPQFADQLENFTNFRFGVVVTLGYILTAVVYMVIMFTGFALFGMSSQGLVLDNYDKNDLLASIARLATGTSVLGSYPLLFAALRVSLRNCLANTVHLSFNAMTMLQLTIITILSFFITDLGFVVSMTGSLTDGPMIYVLPPLVLFKVMKRYPEFPVRGWPTVLFNRFLLVFGIFFTIFASVVSILNTFTTLLK